MNYWVNLARYTYCLHLGDCGQCKQGFGPRGYKRGSRWHGPFADDAAAQAWLTDHVTGETRLICAICRI